MIILQTAVQSLTKKRQKFTCRWANVRPKKEKIILRTISGIANFVPPGSPVKIAMISELVLEPFATFSARRRCVKWLSVLQYWVCQSPEDGKWPSNEVFGTRFITNLQQYILLLNQYLIQYLLPHILNLTNYLPHQLPNHVSSTLVPLRAGRACLSAPCRTCLNNKTTFK